MSFLKPFLTELAVAFALPAAAQTITVSDAYMRSSSAGDVVVQFPVDIQRGAPASGMAAAGATGGVGHGAMMGGRGAASAAGNRLSAPVILLTAFMRDNADALGLNEALRAELAAGRRPRPFHVRQSASALAPKSM